MSSTFRLKNNKANNKTSINLKKISFSLNKANSNLDIKMDLELKSWVINKKNI